MGVELFTNDVSLLWGTLEALLHLSPFSMHNDSPPVVECNEVQILRYFT